MPSRETVAREAKARAIAALLCTEQIGSDVAARLDRRGRLAAATLAGQRPPSDVTWALVVGYLREMEVTVDGNR